MGSISADPSDLRGAAQTLESIRPEIEFVGLRAMSESFGVMPPNVLLHVERELGGVQTSLHGAGGDLASQGQQLRVKAALFELADGDAGALLTLGRMGATDLAKGIGLIPGGSSWASHLRFGFDATKHAVDFLAKPGYVRIKDLGNIWSRAERDLASSGKQGVLSRLKALDKEYKGVESHTGGYVKGRYKVNGRPIFGTTGLKRASTALGRVGTGLTVLDAGSSIYGAYAKGGTRGAELMAIEKGGGITGSVVGGRVGAVAGATLGGMVGGPVGAVVGGFVGSAIGSYAGGKLGAYVGKKLGPSILHGGESAMKAIHALPHPHLHFGL